MKNISDILNGTDTNGVSSREEQTELFGKLKEIKFFELAAPERDNLIKFISTAEQDLAKDYLFLVLDNEISYPIDDEKAKVLFADERLKNLKEQMMLELAEDETEAEATT